MKNDKISVVIPTYKRDSSMLKRAVDSVLKQTYKNIEVVVIDDNAREELSEFRKNNREIIRGIKDDRIVFVENRNNLGSAGSRNEGIKISTGEYITFLDDDDVYLENKVLNQYEKMKEADADYSITDINLYYTDERNR